MSLIVELQVAKDLLDGESINKDLVQSLVL